MILFPAIDLVGGKAVRLFQGDYDKMTVYGDDPAAVARSFAEKGATHIHLVDLDGAKDGDTPNFEVVKSIKDSAGVFCEIGGGVRSMQTIEKYVGAGLDRVILGTAAVEEPDLVRSAVAEYGEKIAVGVDIKDGFVAVKGWLEKSEVSAYDFFSQMEEAGVSTLICTDISRDGAMRGTNRELYRDLCGRFKVNIVASGGVSSLDDIRALRDMGLYGAIIGKAIYTGSVDISDALREAM
jgi:phosphoribosylformimino-5-aminoimidazole carboxamide ribotide isomerase